MRAKKTAGRAQIGAPLFSVQGPPMFWDEGRQCFGIRAARVLGLGQPLFWDYGRPCFGGLGPPMSWDKAASVLGLGTPVFWD